MPILKPSDISPLSKPEMQAAIAVEKEVIEPIPDISLAGAPRAVTAMIDVYYEDSKILDLKGVQLALEFSVNNHGQLRHRFFDQAREQNICLFHVEENHKDENGNRVPHIQYGWDQRKRERWPCRKLDGYKDSVEAVLEFLHIRQKKNGVYSFERE